MAQFLFSLFALTILSAPLAASASISVGAPVDEQQDQPLAPDGRPGLGTKRGAREVGALIRSPSKNDEALLLGLRELSSDILVLREMARRIYEQRGYFDALGDAHDVELAALHASFRVDLKRAHDVLSAGGEAARALASLMLDLRFRLRMQLLDAAAEDVPELRRGLALLKGSQDGYYDLKDGEARAITRRVDLAAARLRAVRSDLDALRERGDANAPGSADPAWGAELLGIANVPDAATRRSILQSVEGKLEQRMQRLSAVLFSPRLEPRLKSDLDKRRALLDQANVHLERAKSYLLLPPHDKDPSEVVLEMSRSERHHYAFSEGLRGLDLDPLNEQLTYCTGIAAAEFQDPRLSRAWFDRYLALRGIRSGDHRTMRDRELTPEETRCVEEVMRIFTTPGGGLGPR